MEQSKDAATTAEDQVRLLEADLSRLEAEREEENQILERNQAELEMVKQKKGR
ncbi:hypothetical protein ACFL5V_02270 [Fibrobacterota bacterium]